MKILFKNNIINSSNKVLNINFWEMKFMQFYKAKTNMVIKKHHKMINLKVTNSYNYQIVQ